MVLVAACKIFRCGMWNLVSWPGIEPVSPALGLSHWTTREVPGNLLLLLTTLCLFSRKVPGSWWMISKYVLNEVLTHCSNTFWPCTALLTLSSSVDYPVFLCVPQAVSGFVASFAIPSLKFFWFSHFPLNSSRCNPGITSSRKPSLTAPSSYLSK